MRILGLNRYVLTVFMTSVALPACGASHSSTGGPGILPQSAATTRKPRQDASRRRNIYVANEHSSPFGRYQTE
jgi:hypothetical protein